MPKTVKISTTRFPAPARKIKKNAPRKRAAKARPQLVSNVRELIAAMGGGKECAEFCSTSMDTIVNWLIDDRVPNGWHFRVHWHLAQRGYVVDPVALEWVSGPEGV